MEVKECSYCGLEKSLDDFHNSVSTKDGKYARCKLCVNEKNAQWRAANPDKVKRAKKSYAQHNAEKIRLQQAGYRRTEKYQEHMGEYRRQYRLAKAYGITVEEYERLYSACQGKCELCNRELSLDRGSGNMACVDHDHQTGKVRGILCRKCNQSLGTFGDSIDGLNRAIEYLQRAAKRMDEGQAGGIAEVLDRCGAVA